MEESIHPLMDLAWLLTKHFGEGMKNARKALRWLDTPNAELDNVSPSELMLIQVNGYEIVMDMLRDAILGNSG